MPRTAHSLAVELARDPRLDLNNAQCNIVASVLEQSEDPELTLKLLRSSHELVLKVIDELK